MYTCLLYDVRDGVATITFNRPDVFNAFNDPQSYELQDALKQVARDASVRAVVLTGAGRAFCSGQDLKAAQGEEKRSFYDSLHKRYNPIIRAMRALPKPIIGRLNGVAAGAGCSLALACDALIASTDASLIEVFINIGLVPDSGSSYFLPRLVGTLKAFELCTLGSKVSAEEALRLGLVNQVVAPEQLDEATYALAARYAAAPTKSIGLIKQMLNKASASTLDEMLDYEAYCQQIAGESDDYREGVQAFLEKRKPQFRGA
ncbi:2-(1,2-epoxy-1,2-dihydrophenyl)acetyl-CoA isomerase [Hymenobacter qilianensis]|uniref:2-(1,2-epoxy-1,2-dihydrophenyl)acetyl-CoA isomerase n=2 Tax=Hymenobacter qilianensis TaxID=1385715 RepID=A0ACB5PNA6_9BACT|nr:enoyl-CoA hydratase-related protein [Hymenobacter qilianensis]QNP53499.1 enoyl-CoA hydratase/isomerase family protein [Hymenobacter qilianensis]GGF55931.1 2-(1,2-epoxy-1,2-dihydrophenyl)acetyl-CoA isomerase [Hymenobacter qilianensis]